MIETKQERDNVLLIGVAAGTVTEEQVMSSLEELEELCDTAGLGVVAHLWQNRESVHQGFYVGTGKLQEIKEYLVNTDAKGIVCDDELTPAQMRNLEEELNCRVLDRTLIILDIFAKRASTKEGNIQVELAQLRYNSSHLTGRGIQMSRLGGGIGTKGPGEKKLETDRRIIRQRIGQLKSELVQIQKHRELTRTKRKRKGEKVAAIVGYTNAGKSTLLNALTDAKVLAEDQLFATLDTTTRLLQLEKKQEILVTDTVGFIHKLPHHLIQAFRSTLEEAKYADLILHVVDCSNPKAAMHIDIVYQTLKELGVKDTPIITVWNKCDCEHEIHQHDVYAQEELYVSAKKGIGLRELKEVITNCLRDNLTFIETVISYDKAGVLDHIRRTGELLEEEYLPEGIKIKAYVTEEYRWLDKKI